MRLKALLAATFACAALATPGQATTYSFDYTGADGLSAIGTLEVVGGQAVSGTGTITSPNLAAPETLTLITLSTPGATDQGGGHFSYRFSGTDLFGDTAYPIDDWGPIFAVSGPGDFGFNFWFDGGTQYESWIVGGDGVYQREFGTATLAETPLPATLPLFATGLGALGLLGWRRKKAQQASA